MHLEKYLVLFTKIKSVVHTEVVLFELCNTVYLHIKVQVSREHISINQFAIYPLLKY